MTRFTSVAAAVILAVVAARGVAWGDTVTWEDVRTGLAAQPEDLLTVSGGPLTTEGFTFTFAPTRSDRPETAWHHTPQYSLAQSHPANGTAFVQVADSMTMQAANGSTFSFAGFDGAEGLTLNYPSYYIPDAIRVTGTFTGGATLAETFTLDQVNDGPGGLADFQTFELSTTWTGLTSLKFEAVDGIRIAIDNIRETPVPEPASLALVGLALGGMVLRRRKRRLA